MKNFKFSSFLIILFALIIFINSQFDLQDYGVILDSKHKSKLHWGTYKPNLYFAMKNRRNTSDVFGLMWYGSDSKEFNLQGDLEKRLRHNCKMEDGLVYNWEAHNGVDYGEQSIIDKTNKLKLETKFVKNNFNDTRLIGDGQQWNVVIKGTVEGNKKTGILLYADMENFEVSDKSHFILENSFMTKKGENNFTFKATEKGKEKYFYNINISKNSKLISRSFQKYRKRYNDTWRVKKFIIDDLKGEEISLNKTKQTWDYINLNPNKNINTPNVVVIQLIFEGDFKIYINYNTNSEKDSLKYLEDDNKSKIESFQENVNNLLNLKKTEFLEKFDKIYWSNLENHNFTPLPSIITNDINLPKLKSMSIQALSNILGGIGYFYGPIQINFDEKLDANSNKYHKGFRYALDPKPLFTGTPSRSFFARGFLWDEGYHNIIISQWDINISIDILDSWLSTMSATGWMAREQIRGAEQEAQVPQKFITQDKNMANPPTFIFPLGNILNYYKYYNEIDKNAKNINNFLKKAFDKFGAWYEWFEIYQKSSDRKSYQWGGRTVEHNLASGLDDYPRGMTPNIYERHIDLTLWISELIKNLRNLSELFDYELVGHFEKNYQKILSELKNNNYDKDTSLYTDYLGPQFKLIKKGNKKVPPILWRGDGKCGSEAPNPLGLPSECNPYSDMPCCSEFGWCGNSQAHCRCEKCKKSEKLENREEFKEKENIFNPHLGYVNLFPIAFGILKIDKNNFNEQDEKVFRKILNLLKNKDELYSDYGIRSLSKNDVLYHTGEDYWRGNIWMNINYLTLRGLYKFYKNDEEAFNVYKMIRENLIKNIFVNWRREGFFYEQYSDIDGNGLKARPFNGWTSLILNIITEKYND